MTIERVMKYLGNRQDYYGGAQYNRELHRNYHAAWMVCYKVWVS